jgi:hypothetical protein
MMQAAGGKVGLQKNVLRQSGMMVGRPKPKPVLVILGGLPGGGKTSLARALAAQIGAVHLRIDSIEQALRDSGALLGPMDAAGYRIAYALAADNLRIGHTVIADSVNPIFLTRAAWRAKTFWRMRIGFALPFSFLRLSGIPPGVIGQSTTTMNGVPKGKNSSSESWIYPSTKELMFATLDISNGATLVVITSFLDNFRGLNNA